MKRWLSLVCGVVLTVTRAPEARGALLDLSFDPRTGPDGPVVRMAQQRDGRLLIAGRFQNFAGVPRPGLVRLHEAGQPDLSFDPGTDQHWEVEELALLPDGRILVGWRLDWRLLQLGEPPDAGLIRLYPNGQRDPSFLPPLEFRPNVRIIRRIPGVSSGPWSPAIRFALLPDGGVVLDGRAFRVAGHEPNSLVRLRPDGSWDETFRPGLSLRNWGVRRIAVAPDGTIWVAGDFAGVGLLRFRADGGWEDWQPPAVVPTTVLEIQVLADGRIVGVGTGLELYSRESRVFRLRADGSVDESFPVAELDREASALAVTRDGGVVLAGLFGSVNGIRRPGLAMLDSSGRLLQSFDPTGLPEGDTKFAQAALMVDSLGRVLVAGNFTQIEGQRRAQLARLYAAPQTYEPPRFYWAKDSVVGRESEGRATLVCVRTGSTAGPDYVRYAAVPDTATAGSDFVAVSGLVVFAPGEDTHAVEIPLINDEVEDPWERFKVILTPYDVGTELGEPHEATVRIADDDLSYVVRVLLPATATATVSENQSRLRLSLYITSQAKPAEDPSLLAPEELVEIAYEELGARVGRDYLPIQRPLFQDIDTVDNLDWLGYYAAFYLPVVDTPGWEGPRQLRLHFRSRSPRVVFIPESCLVTIEDNDNAAGTARFLRGMPDCVAPASTGGWWVTGNFDAVDARPRPGLARLEADEAVDDTFAPQAGPDGPVRVLLEAADGSLYVAGFFRRVGEWERSSVVRYLPDGRVDPNFVPPQAWDLPNRLMDALRPSVNWKRSLREKLPEQVVEYTHGVLLADGRLVLAGWGLFHRPAPAPGVVRLLPDGRADPSFNPPELDLEGLSALTVLPDGRLLVAGYRVLTGEWVLLRLSADGVPEPGRGLRASGPIWALESEPDGQVWVAGDEGLIRLPPWGEAPPCAALCAVGCTVTTNATVVLARQADGRILAGFKAPSGIRLVRLDAQGVKDPGFNAFTFEPFGWFPPYTRLAVAGNGTVAAIATYNYSRRYLVRLNADGRPVRDLRFERLARLPSGEVHAVTRGSPGGLMFEVQRSTRLKRDWTSQGLLQVPHWPPYTLVDTNATRLPYAFYRLAP